jgi:hypothetical protein
MAFNCIPCIAAPISSLDSTLDEPVRTKLLLAIDIKAANILCEVVRIAAAWSEGIMRNRTILVEFPNTKGIAGDRVSNCVSLRH